MICASTLSGTWNRFWFTPQPTSTVALFRIAVGTVILGWSFGLLPGLRDFFSSTGIEPIGVDTTWGLFAHVRSDEAVYVGWGMLAVSAICVIVGFRTTLASIVQFVLVFSFNERSAAIFNSGDGLIRIGAFLLMFMPAGESFSVDRWRRDPLRFWEFPSRAPWALRLMQVQVSVLYLSSARHKLVGGDWADGTALSYVWRMDDIARFPVPEAIVRSSTIVALVTLLALAVEMLIGIFVWFPSSRALVLGLGVALHLAIDLTLRIGFFSAMMMASYVAFLEPSRAATRILSVSSVKEIRSGRRAAGLNETAFDGEEGSADRGADRRGRPVQNTSTNRRRPAPSSNRSSGTACPELPA